MKPSVLSLTVLLLAVSLVLFLLALPRPMPVTVTAWDPCAFERGLYAEGVNDALECFGLLTLELELKGEYKKYGEMIAIVCGRLKVEPREWMIEKKEIDR